MGYPGEAEVVNMRAPSYLGVEALPCVGDGRQSSTSGSPSILNASLKAADNGGLAILRTGDPVRIDLNKCTADILISDKELAAHQVTLIADGGFSVPESQSPWQQYFREMVQPFEKGMTLRDAPNYSDIARKSMPRDSH